MIQAALISIVYFIFSCAYQAQGIYGGDSGDLVTAAVTMGVPHPPGYPLYTALGWFTSHIPLFTPVWRVTLVSSLSHALALYYIYVLTYAMARKHIVAIFATLTLAGNYLFMLYTLTPEVFGLHDLFVALLLYLLYRVIYEKSSRWLIVSAGVWGLAFSHHPIIVFLLPAWAYAIVTLRLDKRLDMRSRYLALGAFVAGLLPYLYIPIAAHGTSIVNWDRAVTLGQFIKLITRADYGTFMSSAAAGTQMYQRFLSIRAYGDFFLLDFSYIGVFLLLVGIFWAWKFKRNFLIACVLGLICIGPGFYFYASFPLGGRFTLGTYERFMLSSYVMIAPFIGLGAYAVVRFLVHRITIIRAKSKEQIIAILSVATLLYPILFGSISVWRFMGLAHDKTAENFALDILASAPPKAIIFLVHDVALFTTQYVRYGLYKRPDTIVIQFSRLQQPDYQFVLKRIFPDLVIPPDSADFTQDFIDKNREYRPILTNSLFPLKPEFEWLPNGLLYQLVPASQKQSPEKVVQDNSLLWEKFHNPTAGVLGRYHHLMLSNVLDEYAAAAVSYGEILGQSGRLDQALKQFEKAISYGSDGKGEDAYIKLGMTQAMMGNCTEALQSLDRSVEFAATPNKELFKYEAIIYRDCLHDASRAAVLFSRYDAVQKKSETPLDQL